MVFQRIFSITIPSMIQHIYCVFCVSNTTLSTGIVNKEDESLCLHETYILVVESDYSMSKGLVIIKKIKTLRRKTVRKGKALRCETGVYDTQGVYMKVIRYNPKASGLRN